MQERILTAKSWLGRLDDIDPRIQGLVAFVLYELVTVAIWGWHALGRLSSSYVGAGHSDAKLYAWALAWWPYALSHGLNPLVSRVAWAPGGINMAWVTGLPGPALLLAPVTVTFGPIASANVLALLAPGLAGWAAYLVCRRVTRRFLPSATGGYLFGLSTYMVNQMHGHLNLVLIFPVPLCVYLVLRRMDGDLSRRAFIVLLAAALVGQFSISTEVFATLTLFGCVTLAGAFFFGGGGGRERLRPVLGGIGWAYALAVVVLSPYLFSAFTNVPSGPLRPLDKSSTDLLGFVVPRRDTLIGGHAFRRFTRAFTLNNVEDGSYLGIPLLGVVSLFAWRERRNRAAWLLLALFAVFVIASLGPALHVHGNRSVPLPWTVPARLPIIQNALPERLTAYLWLVMAVIAGIWLSRPGREQWARWGLVFLAAVLILPSTPSPPFFREVRSPSFFSRGAYHSYLAPGEIVLPIPFAQGTAMLWQAETDMYFRQAGAYVGSIPPQYIDPTVRALHEDQPELIDPQAFLRWVTTNDVGAVVVADSFAPQWDLLLQNLGVRPEEVGGVTLYRLRATPGHPVLRTPGLTYAGDLRVGGNLRSFSLPELTGDRTVTYRRFVSKPLVIEFFASWCRACVNELRALVQVHRALGHRVGFLGVAQSDRVEDATSVVRRAGVLFPTASDPLGRFFGGFHGTTMPLTVLVGADGRIAAIETAPLTTKGLRSLVSKDFGM